MSKPKTRPELASEFARAGKAREQAIQRCLKVHRGYGYISETEALAGLHRADNWFVAAGTKLRAWDRANAPAQTD